MNGRLVLKHAWFRVKSGRDIDIYVLILVCVVMIALDLIGLDVSRWANAILLAALAAFALALLRIRGSLARIDVSGIGEQRFLLDYPDSYKVDVRLAAEIRFVGVTLVGTLRKDIELLKQKVADGRVVTFIIIDPESFGMQCAAQRITSSERSLQHTSGALTQETLGYLRELAEVGKIEARFTDSALSFGATHVVGGGPEKVYMEHYPYKGQRRALPKQVITPRDGDWLGFFKSEIDQLWENAVQIDLRRPDAR